MCGWVCVDVSFPDVCLLIRVCSYFHVFVGGVIQVSCFYLVKHLVKSQTGIMSDRLIGSFQFPVPPEPDHCSMLRKVRSFPYEIPLSFSPPLALLITEVAAQNVQTKIIHTAWTIGKHSLRSNIELSSTNFGSVCSVLILSEAKTPKTWTGCNKSNTSLKSPSIAFMQDRCPPPQDHWALQTSNLLQWGNLWPHPAAAPACGGNSKLSECCSFNVCMFSTCLSWIVQVILQLRERPDRAAKARRGLTLSLQPLKGFDYDSFLSPPSTPETQQDTGRQPQTAMALPGPVLRLQAPQAKGPRREVFVWLGLQHGRHGQHFVCHKLSPFRLRRIVASEMSDKFMIDSFKNYWF